MQDAGIVEARRRAARRIGRGLACVVALPALVGAFYMLHIALVGELLGLGAAAWGTREIVIGLVARAVARKQLRAMDDPVLPPARIVD